jgi:hypothetical protein
VADFFNLLFHHTHSIFFQVFEYTCKEEGVDQELERQDYLKKSIKNFLLPGKTLSMIVSSKSGLKNLMLIDRQNTCVWPAPGS